MESNASRLDASPLPLLYLLGNLKSLPRTGWLRTIAQPETVASHSFRVAVMGLFAPEGLDMRKCMLMGLVHDMAEAVIGDITPHDGVSKERKFLLEDTAFRYIESLLQPSQEIGALLRESWLEYAQCKTKEAQFMYQVDKLECLIQAREYERETYGQKDLDEFQGLTKKITHPYLKEWVGLLNADRKLHFARLKHQTPIVFVPGTSGIPNETIRTFLSEAQHEHVLLSDALREKSREQGIVHANILKEFLEKGIDVPTDMVVALLQEKIQHFMEGQKLVIVGGFPKSVKQLREFETKVQKDNYMIVIRPQKTAKMNTNLELERHYATRAELLRMIDCTLELSDTKTAFKQAVADIIEHHQGEKQT